MNEMEVIQSKIYELRGQRVMLDIAEYHFYITGHQGNIRVVANQNGIRLISKDMPKDKRDPNNIDDMMKMY